MRDAAGPGTTGTANAVYIGFGHVWQIKIDNVGKVIYINTAGGNICSYQYL